MTEAGVELPMVATVLITLAGLFLLGLVADLLGTYTPLPRVTILLLAGFAIGSSGFDLLPGFTQEWFPTLTNEIVRWQRGLFHITLCEGSHNTWLVIST